MYAPVEADIDKEAVVAMPSWHSDSMLDEELEEPALLRWHSQGVLRWHRQGMLHEQQR